MNKKSSKEFKNKEKGFSEWWKFIYTISGVNWKGVWGLADLYVIQTISMNLFLKDADFSNGTIINTNWGV